MERGFRRARFHLISYKANLRLLDVPGGKGHADGVEQLRLCQNPVQIAVDDLRWEAELPQRGGHQMSAHLMIK